MCCIIALGRASLILAQGIVIVSDGRAMARSFVTVRFIFSAAPAPARTTNDESNRGTRQGSFMMEKERVAKDASTEFWLWSYAEPVEIGVAGFGRGSGVC